MILAASGAGAASAGRKAAVERLFVADAVSPDWFAPAFLAQVPAEQVNGIVADLKRRYGPLSGIEDDGDRLTVNLGSAAVPARVMLDSEGRIAGLFFETPIPAGGYDAAVAAISALPGRVSLLVMTNGQARTAIDADTPLAVGSAAKLAVLAALEWAVSEGRLDWDAAVALQPGWRSLPTGVLQDWPQGTPVTIATLANLAVSISDNTATDALIGLVGREAVEAVTPRNTPFPTTRQLFILKAAGNAALRQAWLGASPAERRALIGEIDALPLPHVHELDPDVTSGIEWFLSAGELCALLEEVGDLPAFSINRGPAGAGGWRSVAYKGGSEPGVLNLSSRLVDAQGNAHCIVATWNDTAALREEALLGPYRGLLRALASGS